MMNTITSVNFRGLGSESCGSIAYMNSAPETAGSIAKTGMYPETAGSVAFQGNKYDKISFQAKENSEKKFPIGKVLFGLVGLTAATIVGLGYAHKSGSFNNIQKEWLKNTYGKLEPVAETCHKWCGTVKKTGIEWWNKFVNLFRSKS